MIMASYLDYAGRDGERSERWPNLREAAARSFMGQTAVIGRRPWLVIGFDGEMYELENEFGERMRTNQFEVIEHQSNNNRLVASTRIEGSPLDAGFTLVSCGCDVGALDFDRESYEWSVLTEKGDIIDIEARVAELEDADWKVADTLHNPDPDLARDTDVSEYYCPECGSPDIDFGDDVAYCLNCGWHGHQDEVHTDADRSYDHAEENPRLDPYDRDDWQHAGSMDKGSPYPENSEKNAPDHSPPNHKWPKKVNEIYNACMREDRGRGDTKEEKESSCAAIANAQYNKMKKGRSSGRAAEADAIEQDAAKARAAGDAKKAAELKDLADQKRVAKIVRRGDQYCVVSESGNKDLGCSDSMEGAKKRLKEVEYFKHQGNVAILDTFGANYDAIGDGPSDRLDNVKPLKCPNCGSHTVEMLNTEGDQFHCLACGKKFKHEVIKNPSAPKEKKGKTAGIPPAQGLEYYTPDAVAETLPVSHETGMKLWQLVTELEQQGQGAPIGGDRHDPYGEHGTPMVEDPYSQRDVISEGRGNMVSIWDRLTPAEQEEINAAYAKEFEGYWKGATFQLMDSDGNPVSSGHYYNLHGDKYKIPDVIKVLDITPEHVVATVDDNATPLKITSADVESNGYSFEKLPIYSNVEQHDLREAVSWLDGDLLSDQPVYDQPILRSEQRPDNAGPTYSPVTDRETEFTLPTPSGGTLWVRADNDGRVTGWSVPSFDGGPGQYSNRDLDHVQSMVDQERARAVRSEPSLAKTARRAFTPGEQKKLIEEKGNARNKDKLRLEDSHYTESAVEDDDLDFLF